jgi:FKBP-type peptidyl-prolyl cis-trans isomerase FklB
MRKPFIMAVNVLAIGMMFLGNARAQQTSAPAAAPQNTPPAAQQAPATNSAQPNAAKTQKAPAAKTGQAPTAKTQTPLTLKTDKDKASYAIGRSFGSSLRKQSIEVEPSILVRGLKDGLADSKPLLTEDEMKDAISHVQADARKKQEEKMAQAGDANKKEGQAFLDANKLKEGVVTLPSGLQYKILQAGTGPKPTTTDSVVCNYRGTLINGKEFDSSYKRGQPATFPVSGVIKGWTEALQLMPVGSKWQLFVPSELAYGARGAGGDIGPNATLIFEVELISIQAKSK